MASLTALNVTNTPALIAFETLRASYTLIMQTRVTCLVGISKCTAGETATIGMSRAFTLISQSRS